MEPFLIEGRYRLQLDSRSSILNSVTKSNWIVQTAATDHICTSLHWFLTSWSISPLQIRLGDGNMITTDISGIVQLTDSITLFDVLFVPESNVNMISVGKLTECEVGYELDFCRIKESNSGKVLGIAKLIESQYHLQFDLVRPLCHTDHLGHKLISTNLPNCICTLWHLKLGHLCNNRMMVLDEKYDYIPVLVPNVADACDLCRHIARGRPLPAFSIGTKKAKTEFELMHVNIWKPYSVISIPRFSCSPTIVDDFSRFTWIYLLKSESVVGRYIEKFVNLVETRFSKKIKTICSNGRPEFLLSDFYTSKGIIHDTSCVEMAQKNYLFENILNVSKALMDQSNILELYWGYAVLHSAYLINRIPIELLGNKSPFEVLHGKLPDLIILRVFGCLCYPSTPQPAKKCVFLGFHKVTESFLLLDITTSDDILELESQDVIFHDTKFPFYENRNRP